MASTHPPHALGRWGEAVAARLLERRGWEIVARNYRAGRGEVDLVARRDGVLAFVEVKTRAGEGYGSPLEAITRAKRREIERVARAFLRGWTGPVGPVRFDAVAVRRRPGGLAPLVEHVEDAWRPGWG
jgi:putative endonuclease